MTTGKRLRISELERQLSKGPTRGRVNTETTYCYCPALDLTWPHYIAEHTQDHDDAQKLRAERAGSTE